MRFDDVQNVSQALQYKVHASGVLKDLKYTSLTYELKIHSQVIRVLSITAYDNIFYNGKTFMPIKLSYALGRPCRPLLETFSKDGSYLFTASHPYRIKR